MNTFGVVLVDLESFWYRFGFVLGSFWDRFGIDCYRFGIVFESFWNRFGRFGIVLGGFGMVSD